MAIIILSEFVDHRNGKRYGPNDSIDPPLSREQEARLAAAGCIRNAKVDPAAIVREAINVDGLFGKSRAALLKVAAAESIDIAKDATPETIIAAIRENRVKANS